MDWRVVYGKPVPNLTADLLSVQNGERLAAMSTEIVHDQVDRGGVRIGQGQLEQDLRELEPRPIRRGEREMPAGLGFHGTEDIGCTAALVFIVLSRFLARLGGRTGPDIGMERDRLFVQAQYRLFGIVGTFVRRQHILHPDHVGFIDIGDAPHFFPATA